MNKMIQPPSAFEENRPALWVEEILAAFEALGGAARYDELYEYINRTTKRNLTPEWKATVRRTIEDHSSNSMNFRGKDLFRRFDHGFWGLRKEGEVNALIERRRVQKPKEVVDRILHKIDPLKPLPELVHVREHWRNWPSPSQTGDENLPFKRSVFEVVDAWTTDLHIEIKIKSGLVLKVAMDHYPQISSASRCDLSNLEIGEFGVHWPQLAFQLTVAEILFGENLPTT